MSADSELLIKIKTILESQGIDAAKAKIDELTKTTNASGLSEAAANRERDKSADKAEKTAKAIIAMNSAMAGGMGPFRTAVYVANQLGGSFAMLAFKASAVGAAITIGWNVGTKLREWVTGAKEADAELEKLKKVSAELGERITKLSAIRLTELKKEADEIAKGFSTAVDKAERLKRLSDLREDAQLANDLAGVDLRFKKGEINANERDRLELQFTNDSEMRKNQSEGKRITSSEQVSKDTEFQARRKHGELSRKAGMAQQDYDQGVQQLKDAGIEDPENDMPDFDAEMDKKKKLVLKVYQLRWKRYTLDQNKKINGSLTDSQQKESVAVEQEMTSVESEMSSINKRLKAISTVGKELPGKKTVRDMANKELAEYKPTYDRVLQEESDKREQLEADKDVLVNRFEKTRTVRSSGMTGIQNRINSDFDTAVSDAASPAEKARAKGRDLLDSLKLNHRTVLNNAGDPLSAKGQAAYDQSRSQSATDMVNSAMNQAYKGGNSVELTNALVNALKNRAGAELVLREDQVKEILDAIQSIGKQASETSAAVKTLKSQSQIAPGLD